ncbi:MAG: hypothetical protein LLG44_12515 [Chloroflexi bacterium]|nr:hypothetical protein [Chloroflexota bacterium]
MWDDYVIEGTFGAPSPVERVLVVIVPSQRDWELVQHERWYRIPVARAPARLAAEYLAFYHTSKMEERWSICHYAPVRGYRLCKRRELLPAEANHPRAEQAYYKIELGPLETLPQPIPSLKLRRITFIATTMERLLQARDVSELWEHDSRTDQLRRVLAISDWLWWQYY